MKQGRLLQHPAAHLPLLLISTTLGPGGPRGLRGIGDQKNGGAGFSRTLLMEGAGGQGGLGREVVKKAGGAFKIYIGPAFLRIFFFGFQRW